MYKKEPQNLIPTTEYAIQDGSMIGEKHRRLSAGEVLFNM